MFASLHGFSALSEAMGAERAYLVVTGCLRLLDGIARRHGGSVDKFLGDSLMAVFGHPVPIARPARGAVLAALEMREQVYDYNRELDLRIPLDVQIGIATGPLVAGDVRGSVVREFHVLGSTVNLAARLKSNAPPGVIYASVDAAEEAGDAFVFRAVEPLVLKGKSRRVPAFEVCGVDGGRHARSLATDEPRLSPLIGREAELRRLHQAVARLAAGRGGAVAILGEEGIGKSRLLAELGNAPEIAGVDVWLAHPAARGAGEMPGALVSDLLAAADGDGAPDAGGAPPSTRLREALLAGCARRPLLVAIDDLERADRASLEAIADAVPLAVERPLLFVLTTRTSAPAAPPIERARSLGAGFCEELALEPLGPAAARQLVAELAREAGLSDAACTLVEERGAGNPARLLLGVHLAPALATESELTRARERSSDTERRRATILFADISGFTAMVETIGAETAYPIVAGCLQLLDVVARAHGGHVDKHIGDCVMATFGVPEAIEDAARAAVNAAIEMRQRVRDYNREQALAIPLELHVGIHTGLGIAGDISGPLLREFAVMGEPVDLAQQLTDLAQAGQVVVGADTHRLVRGVFAFRPVEVHRLGGVGLATEAFELLSEAVVLHRERIGSERHVHSELVGREVELTTLRERLAALHEGRGAVVSLVAEAGLGKSRLIEELSRCPEAEGVSWFTGRSISTGSRLAFHPFANLLRSWAGIAELGDSDAARAKLEAAVAKLFSEVAGDTATLLGSLLGLGGLEAEGDRFGGIQGDALEKLIRRAVTQLLVRANAAGPAVVVMDDLHWADGSSIELLISLLPLAAQHRILFVNVSRPGFAASSDRVAAAARAAAGVDAIELRLGPLSRAAARQFVNNVFETDGLPHATRASIEEKAHGNPFFIEEVVRSFVDAGVVERRNGKLRATEHIASVVIPDSVHEVVQARVDRQPLRRRGLLQIASVVGRSFDERVLAAVVGDAADLASELRGLEAAEFIVPWDEARGARWAFKHPLIQEVTYGALLETRRQELHRQVARAVEERLPPDAPGWTGMLAYHFSMGLETERAEEFLFRAGEEAARAAASGEALHFFEEASKLYFELHGDAGDPKKKALLERNVGLALSNRGRFLEAVEHYDRALEHLGEPPPRSEGGRALGFARSLASLLVGLYLPLPGALRRSATEVDREVIGVLWQRAQAQTTTSPMRFVFDNVGALARLDRIEARTIPGAGGIYAGAIGIFSYSGVSFAIGRRCLARARRLVRSHDVGELLVYRAMNFVHHMLAGDWSDAHRVDEQLLQEGLRYGRLWEVTNVLNLEGLRCIHRGDFGGARERIKALAAIAEEYQHGLAASAGQFLQAALHLERREIGAAIAGFDHYADEHAEVPFKVSALGQRAAAQCLDGDPVGAEATLTRAQRLIGEAQRILPYHLSNYLRARHLADVQHLEAAGASGGGALASERPALRIAGKVAWRRPEVLRTAAVHAWLRGRRREARRRFGESLAWAERLGMRAEEARTQGEIGRRFGSKESFDRARETFEALGLDAERRTVEPG